MEKSNSISSSEEFGELEASLAGTLRRVTPRRDFVRHLRSRIRLPARDEIASRLRDWQTLFLIFGGVISGLLVLVTIARALFHLFGRRNLG